MNSLISKIISLAEEYKQDADHDTPWFEGELEKLLAFQGYELTTEYVKKIEKLRDITKPSKNHHI